MGFTAADVQDQGGRTFLVTGANTGIGFAAAEVLAARGARVLLGCRSRGRAEDAMARIRRSTPDADLAFVELDLGDLGSIERAARRAGEEPRLDVLVNNAGIMVPPLDHTADGFESQLGVNHLGPFALTGRLLPKLTEQEGSRVVTTSSVAHRGGRVMFDDLHARHTYDRQQRYGQSKLANLLFTFELQRRLDRAGSATQSLACHPGVAETELTRHLPGPARLLTPAVSWLANSAEQGAWPTLQAATDRSLTGGAYVGPQGFRELRGESGRADSTSLANDPELAQRLWDVSVELTGVDPTP